jgi:16S rRNA (guanine966-N2)-methyltransferase
MSDKVRGALFNALGDIAGLSVLDAFAGSGALSFEAVSRGAKSAVAIEPDESAQKAIGENVRALRLSEQVKLVKASAQAWLSTTTETFDILLCDPPYDNLQRPLLQRVAERTKPNGVIVFSLPPATEFALDSKFQLLTAKSYGDAELVFYRRTKVK